jgi:rhodanese-related sulfurtransferase
MTGRAQHRRNRERRKAFDPPSQLSAIDHLVTLATRVEAQCLGLLAKLRFPIANELWLQRLAKHQAIRPAAGEDFVLVDSRGHSSWHQGRIAGAIHLPHAEIAERAPAEIPITTPVVVYCWGPGCNGSTRAALQFSKLGYAVKELIGGFEYWTREGLEIVDDSGSLTRAVDTLTGPRPSNGVISCDC